MAASTARCGGRFSGSTTAALAAMWKKSGGVEGEYRASEQGFRPAFDPPTWRSRIFHRKRKLPP